MDMSLLAQDAGEGKWSVRVFLWPGVRRRCWWTTLCAPCGYSPGT